MKTLLSNSMGNSTCIYPTSILLFDSPIFLLSKNSASRPDVDVTACYEKAIRKFVAQFSY
jgi:hypothetical protein